MDKQRKYDREFKLNAAKLYQEGENRTPAKSRKNLNYCTMPAA
jgi:transposase-like protein